MTDEEVNVEGFWQWVVGQYFRHTGRGGRVGLIFGPVVAIGDAVWDWVPNMGWQWSGGLTAVSVGTVASLLDTVTLGRRRDREMDAKRAMEKEATQRAADEEKKQERAEAEEIDFREGLASYAASMSSRYGRKAGAEVDAVIARYLMGTIGREAARADVDRVARMAGRLKAAATDDATRARRRPAP